MRDELLSDSWINEIEESLLWIPILSIEYLYTVFLWMWLEIILIKDQFHYSETSNSLTYDIAYYY
jgi:hypothetical protein